MVSSAQVRIDGGASYTPEAGLYCMVTTSSWHIRLWAWQRWPRARGRGAAAGPGALACRDGQEHHVCRRGRPRPAGGAGGTGLAVDLPAVCPVSGRWSCRPAAVGPRCAGAADRCQRHRCWSLLGVDIPRAPAAPDGLAAAPAPARSAEATWRQLAYHLVAGPAGARRPAHAGGLGRRAGLVGTFAYQYVFPPLSQTGSDTPKFKIVLTAAGALMLLAAPVVAALVTWIDTRAGAALLGPSRSVELERRVESLSESRAGVVDAADAERRRIERDLHDGAQQRLVSLAMNLGLARENLTELPARGQAGDRRGARGGQGGARRAARPGPRAASGGAGGPRPGRRAVRHRRPGPAAGPAHRRRAAAGRRRRSRRSRTSWSRSA